MSRWRLSLVILCAVAFAVRLWHLQFQSLWWDEGVSIYLAGQGVRALTIDKDFSVDIHPPAYHLALAAWTFLVGPSVFTSRLLSVFAGVLTIPLTVRCTLSLLRLAPPRPRSFAGKSWLAVAGPFVAGVLAVVSPVDVYYSQESRMYPFLPVLGAASLIATVQVLSSGSWRRWLVWVAINVAGLYVFYYLGFLAVAESAVLLLFRGPLDRPTTRRQWISRWAISQVAIVLGFVPWIFVVASRLGGMSLALPVETEVHLTSWQFVVETWTAYTVGFTIPPDGYVFTVLWALLAVAGVIALARLSRAPAALSLVALLGPTAAAGAVLLLRPFYFPRFVLFVLVPLWALVAIGATALPGLLWPPRDGGSEADGGRAHRRAPLPGGMAWIRTYGPGFVAAIVIVILVTANAWTWNYERTTPRVGYAPDDYRTVFTSVAERLHPGDLILGGYPWQAGYARAYFWRFAPRVTYVNAQADPSRVADEVAAAARAWVLTYSPNQRFDPDRLEAAVAKVFPTAFVDQSGDTRARLVSDLQAPLPDRAFASLGYQILVYPPSPPVPSQVHPGDMVSVVLHWGYLASTSGNYKVFVHLESPDGKLWGQVDSPPVHGAFPTRDWAPGFEVVDRYAFTVDPRTPAGRYVVKVGMYNPEYGTRLSVSGGTGASDSIDLGPVTVVAP